MIRAQYDLDAAVPHFIAYVGGRWGEDVYDRPDIFTVCADGALVVLERHFSVRKVEVIHLVPYWARCLAEVLASSGIDPTVWLVLAKNDAAFRDAVRAALALGGYVGLRDYLKAQGVVA